jgi:type IV pilus assembly protein PilB
MPGTAQEILAILVADHRISQSDADNVSTQSLSTGESIEEILKKKHLIPEIDLSKARAKSLNIPFVTLVGRAIGPDVINYFPEPVIRRYTVIPFQFDSQTNELSVAMVDPLDFQVIEFLEKKAGKTIRAYMAMKDDILSAIEATYTQNLGKDVSAALKESETSEIKTYEAGHLGEVIREAPIAQIVSATLEQAIHLRASDVHIEPQEGDTRIRYRVDGILQERLVLPKRLHDAVVSRIKILGNMKIDEKRIPQDGRFNFKMGDSEVDLRVSTLPTVHGE